MRPESPADLAFAGLIGPDDMPGPAWTAICRENGWEDAIARKGAAAKAWSSRRWAEGNRKLGAAHCAFAGCGRWIAAGADRCTAGHAQHERAPELEAIPF
jgi:hypothetical protein